MDGFQNGNFPAFLKLGIVVFVCFGARLGVALAGQRPKGYQNGSFLNGRYRRLSIN